MKIIIIEDELGSAFVIEHLVNSFYPDIEIVGKAVGVDDARVLIENNDFDLALMDIQIKGGTSFDLLNSLVSINFKIIFITANERYALDAFKNDAIDFIVKPINSIKLKKAIDKALVYLVSQNSNNNISGRLLINTARELYAVRFDEIIRLEADNNYTKIVTANNGSILSSKTLKEYELFLERRPNFVRVHRSHIINIGFFHKIEKKAGDIIFLTNGDRLTLASNRKQQFFKMLEK